MDKGKGEKRPILRWNARFEYTAKIGWTILWFGMPGILAVERMVEFNVIEFSIQFALVS